MTIKCFFCKQHFQNLQGIAEILDAKHQTKCTKNSFHVWIEKAGEHL